MMNRADYVTRRLTFEDLNEIVENFLKIAFDLDFYLSFIYVLVTQNGERHGKYYISAEDIFEQEFGREVRGYSKARGRRIPRQCDWRTMKPTQRVEIPSSEIADLKEENYLINHRLPPTQQTLVK